MTYFIKVDPYGAYWLSASEEPEYNQLGKLLKVATAECEPVISGLHSKKYFPAPGDAMRLRGSGKAMLIRKVEMLS